MLIMAVGAVLMAQGSRAMARALDALELRARRWFSSPTRSGSP